MFNRGWRNDVGARRVRLRCLSPFPNGLVANQDTSSGLGRLRLNRRWGQGTVRGWFEPIRSRFYRCDKGKYASCPAKLALTAVPGEGQGASAFDQWDRHRLSLAIKRISRVGAEKKQAAISARW